MKCMRNQVCVGAFGLFLWVMTPMGLLAQSAWVPSGASGGGDWDTAGNWSPASVPNGSDAVVYFTNNISADATITMSAGKIFGTMILGDGLGTADKAWSFQPGAAQTLTALVTSGSASIIVTNGLTALYSSHRFYGQASPVLYLGSDLIINVASGVCFGSRGPVTSAAGKNLTITGGGQGWFENTLSGNTGNMIVSNASLVNASSGSLLDEPSTHLFTGNLLMHNAILLHQNTFNRTIGTGAGQVQFSGTSVGFTGRSANNTATSGRSVLDLNGNGSTILAGDSGTMPPTTFNFNVTALGMAANVPLTVSNSINLNGNTVTINAGPSSGNNYANGVTIAGGSGITGSGNLIVSGGAFLKVVNGLNHTGNTTVDNGNLLAPVFPSGKVVLANGGVLHASGLISPTLGTGAGELDIGSTALGLGAYGGDLIVRMNGGTNPLNASTLNSLLTLNGPVATGQIDFQNPVNIDTALLTLSASPGGYACLVPSGNYGSAYSIMAALSGTGALKVTGGSGGMVVLKNRSTYEGATTIDGGSQTVPAHSVALFAQEGIGLTSNNLTLKNGGILATYGTFTRGIGTGANQVQWAATARGGFAAVGGNLAVRLNNGAGAITVGDTSTFSSLVLGSEFSTHTVDFQNGLNTGSIQRDIVVAGSVEQKISGDITGSGGINMAIGSFGTLVLSGNNSFGAFGYGGSYDQNVVVKLGSATALGSITSFPNIYRGVLDLAGYSVSGVSLTLGHMAYVNNQYVLQNSSTNTESTWGGALTVGLNQGLFGGPGDLRVTGTVNCGNNGTMQKAGTGKLTLAGTSGSYPGNSSFYAYNGSLVLDYTVNNVDKVPTNGTGAIFPYGCALSVLGNDSAPTTATLANFKVGYGLNTVTVTSGNNQNATLALNACSRNVAQGAAVDFNLVNVGSGAATITTTTTTLYNNLLKDGASSYSGYATFNGGRTWATVSGGNIVGLAAFDALGTSNGNIDLSGDQNVSSSITYNSLRFNGGVSTLTIDTTKTLTFAQNVGAILMTPEATGKATLASTGTGQFTYPYELLVHQYNTNYDLEISAASSYGNNCALTKVGPGLLYMSNTNATFDGNVYILGGTLRTDSINATMGSGSSGVGRGLSIASGTRFIHLGGGARFLYQGSGHTTDRDFSLMGDGVIDASGSGALTINPQVYAVNGRSVGLGVTPYTPYDLTLQGSGDGILNGVVRLGATDQAYGGFMAGKLFKKGSGTWTLNGAENIMRELIVQGGTFTLGHASNTLVDNAHVRVDAGGTLALGANSDKVGVVTLRGGSITGSGVLQGLRYDVESGTIETPLAGAVSALTKTTAGTVTLNGSNTYLGDTLVQEGKLVSASAISGNVYVSSGATLQALGTVGGDLTLTNGSTFAVALGASPSALTVNGVLTLTGATLSVDDSAGMKAMTLTGSSIVGTFASVSGPYTPRYSGNEVTIGPAMGTLFYIQ